MQNDLLVAGIACVMAALIGGGLKAFTIEIPLLSSIRRQFMLGVFGAVLMTLSFGLWRKTEAPSQPVVTPPRKVVSLPSPSPEAPAQPPQVEELSLAKTSYSLPEDGIEMKNSKVGPFCCTGRVVIVRAANGDPIGYVYFYSWRGQAYNGQSGSIVPDISIQVSGPATLGNSSEDQPTSEINFQAAQLKPQSEWTQAGILQYRATVLDFKLERGPLFSPYFKMDSLKIRIDVRPAKSS